MPGGSRQINSGRTSWQSKRDNKLYEFLIEARTTSADSCSIKRDEFLEIKRQAHATPPGFMPAMQIDMRDLAIIAVELHTFNEMQRMLIDLEAQVQNLQDRLNELA
jgi:hypothetical protein